MTVVEASAVVDAMVGDDVPRSGRRCPRRLVEVAQQRDLRAVAVSVLLRTGPQPAAVVEANPFPAATADPRTLHAGFLSAPVDARALAGIDRSALSPDDIVAGDGVVYLRYPNGAGRSKLTTELLERRLGVRVTARNRNTVTTLVTATTRE